MIATLSPTDDHDGREAVMDLKTFGLRLRKMREAAGWSQKQLADKAGLTQRAISSWETGEKEPGWLSVLALAKTFSVDCTAFEEEPEEETASSPGQPSKAKPKPGRPRKPAADQGEPPAQAKKGRKPKGN
jgi:transcriptional regulator with XRE-family HTH domain